MSFPKISTLNNIYNNRILNPQWNTFGGIFGVGTTGFDAYVGVTHTPSFIGAAIYDSSVSSFSAQVTPAPLGNGTTQTSLLLKYDEQNFVEMFVGPAGTFGGYVANDANPSLPASPFPAYDPVAHAFWKISNDDYNFFFDVSPDGITWTNLGFAPFDWAIKDVTVMFLAGFTGSETDGMKASINNINGNFASTQLKGSTSDFSHGMGSLILAAPLELSGIAHGVSRISGRAIVNPGLPMGGVSDFSVAPNLGEDGVKTRLLTYAPTNAVGGVTRTYVRPYIGATAPTPYRDGTYWAPSTSVFPTVGADTPDTNLMGFTNVQIERTPSQGNRLSVTASYYTDSCEYVAQKALQATGVEGSTSVTRSSEVTQAGKYAGKMVYGGIPVVDGAGNNAYWPYPTRNALTPIITNVVGQETLRGSVSLSTTRAGTKWYPAFVFYDVNFNVLSASSFSQPTVSNMMTHPGSGSWQTGSILMPNAGVAGAVWAAVVPVVVAPVSGTETVYMSGHSLVGITPTISSYPSAYVDPQQLTVELKADRVNLARNSGFVNNVNGWTTTVGPITLAPDAQDSFTRTVSNGWGTAPTGGAWSTDGGTVAEYSVNGSNGVHSMSATSTARRTYLTTTNPAQDIRAAMFINTLPLGNSIFMATVSRATDDNNHYQFRISFDVGGNVIASIRKRVASVETALATSATSIFTYSTPGKRVFTRFYVHGNTLQAKAWLEGTIEPAAWLLTATDSSFSAAGQVGCRSVLNAGNTNTTPFTVFYDDFSMNSSPVSRGWDGTVGLDSLGSLKVSVIPPTTASAPLVSTASIGAGSALINNTSLQYPVITGLIPGNTYTVSAWVKPGFGCPNIFMKCFNPNYDFAFIVDLNTIRANYPDLTKPNGWVRMFSSFTVPPNGPGDYELSLEVHFADAKVAAPFDYWVDSVLVEEGTVMGDYFDGNFSSADYQYEKQGSTESRSYYYKDLTNKLSRVNRIIPQYTPVGTTANVIFAQSP